MTLATQPALHVDVAHATADMLARLGVEYAFGIVGGEIVPFADALAGSVQVVHCRHEAGAAFAAVECSLARGRPAAVFVTTGPGLLNAVNGLVAARWEGAHVIVVSSITSAPLRGRGAFQETTVESIPAGLLTSGSCFDYAVVPEDPRELATIFARLRAGLQRPSGFVANVGLTRAMQCAPAPAISHGSSPRLTIAASRPAVAELAATLARSRFVIWVGHGARRAAANVRALAARSGAPVMSSPRGKGIFPESSSQYLGVTGFGGDDLAGALRAIGPEYTLVLGSRLGEFTSFYSPELLPSKALIHVDVDDRVFGAAYPQVATHGIHGEIDSFLEALLGAWPAAVPSAGTRPAPPERAVETCSRASATQRAVRPVGGKIRPSALMGAIQRVVVEESDAIVMTEAGNSFAWGSASLRFDSPRYRVSTGWGSMGHASSGVVGAALGSGKKAVAVLGDGAMLMQSELSTAMQYGVSAVWIVMNDGGYGMIRQGMQREGFEPHGMTFPAVDFTSYAQSMGATAMRVTDESDLEAALFRAMSHQGPFVLDVVIDPDEPSPMARRVGSLQEGSGRR